MNSMKTILQKIFPKTIDNQFNGYKVALYFFYLLTLVTLWRSQHHLFSADGGAQSIASIPIDAFTSDGATTVIGIFSLWGLSQLIIGFIYVATALRYKSLIPFMYLLMWFEYLMRAVYIGTFKPVITIDTAPGVVGNYVFIILVPILLALSLLESKKQTGFKVEPPRS